MFVKCVVLVAAVMGASAMPRDPVLMKLSPDDRRFQYVMADDDAGSLHLVDSWVKLSDLSRQTRFNAETDTQYHLFTRQNPSQSQVLLRNNAASITNSNFNRNRRTVILIHGWLGSATAGSNTVLVPAYLAAEDVNVIVIDWSAGSTIGIRGQEVGRAVGNFVNWLNGLTGATPSQYHVIGFSVGGHTAGVVGRTVTGNVGYITGLDPSERWITNQEFRPSDAAYTEVIHTSVNDNGWFAPLAHVDFYPNGGVDMPGCLTTVCDHERSYHYMGESIRSGGFTGNRCTSHLALDNCTGARLAMGGRLPKTGSQGVYYVRTNIRSPFSQG